MLNINNLFCKSVCNVLQSNPHIKLQLNQQILLYFLEEVMKIQLISKGYLSWWVFCYNI